MLRARDEKAKDARKQHILECAELIIREKGLEQLSIAGVAKKTALSVGTIYLYFEKKEDIIAQLTIKSREVLLQNFQEAAALSTHALEQIQHILLAYFQFYKHHPFYHQLVSFYETNSGLEETGELLQASKDLIDFVRDILRKGKQLDQVKPEIDEQEFSLLLWGTAVGIIQLVDVKPTLLERQLNKPAELFYLSYIRLIINYLSK